jgi:predicted ATPase/transcriptional regulator with XRE-family HTH domain
MKQHSFGYWLKRRRKALDLTQVELASQVGCSAAAIRKIEADERRPSAQIVVRLAEVFNILPNEQTSFLRFARGDWRSAPARKSEDTPWRAVDVLPRSNLPASTTSLIGRKYEVDVVREYLSNASIRLVTLIGPPGIGKTRLSLEVAREVLSNFPNGVFFVPLAPLDDPKLVAPTIVQTLGFVETKNQPPLERLKDGIEDKKMLLVLDNLEHLIEGAAPLISELLMTCPHLKILTTSRESLRVPGEWLYSVPTLDVPDTSQLSSSEMEAVTEFPALALFAERARAVRSDFMLNTENVESIATICTQLDGLPLAIELIAARIRLMSPQSLLTHLNYQFTLYADGIRAVAPRQKTLHGAIAWSYDLLSVEEQRLFVYVSAFTGGFTLDAAGAIFSRTSTDKSVSDLITSLLDKSLLQRAIDERGELRFNMLMTIQQFALDHLRGMGEETEVRNWHLTYFLDLAEQADKEMHGPHQVEWTNRLGKELDNFRAALDWSVSNKKAELALRVLGALSWTWFVRDHFSEIRSWFDKIRALPEINDHPALYARLLNHMGMQSWLSGDFREARSVLEESQVIWLRLGADGERGLAGALVNLGLVACASEGDNKTAQSFFERSFEVYQKHGDQWGMAFVLFNLGGVVGERIDNNLALSLLEQSLDLFHQLGDVWGMGRASQWLGQHFLKQGNYEKARVYFDQHLRIDEGLHFKQGTMIALQNLGTLYRHQGDYAQAEQFYQKGLLICREYGGKWELSNNFYYLGLLALHRNDYLLARQYFIDYFNLARTIYAGGIDACDLCTGLAAVAAGTNQPKRAARLYGAAQALFESTDYQIPPFDLAEFDRHIQIARDQLGEATFEALAAEGHAMTMEQAIVYALEDK